MAVKYSEKNDKKSSVAGLLSRVVMQIAVSTCLLGASLFVILSGQYDPSIKHWAFATIGTILGFWFRGSETNLISVRS
jgi:uncharacterized membrane protein (UPF0136 family)